MPPCPPCRPGSCRHSLQSQKGGQPGFPLPMQDVAPSLLPSPSHSVLEPRPCAGGGSSAQTRGLCWLEEVGSVLLLFCGVSPPPGGGDFCPLPCQGQSLGWEPQTWLDGPGPWAGQVRAACRQCQGERALRLPALSPRFLRIVERVWDLFPYTLVGQWVAGGGWQVQAVCLCLSQVVSLLRGPPWGPL